VNEIPFIKAHGAGNDFLFTWRHELPPALRDLPWEAPEWRSTARSICRRQQGVGADGWYVMSRSQDADAEIHLYNSDGSPAELSGNGTRCAAAVLAEEGLTKDDVCIRTGAGLRTLQLTGRDGLLFWFEMNMGQPAFEPEDLRFLLPLSAGPREVAILDVGNPQCAVPVDNWDFDWIQLGAEIEAHPRFPRRTNVSFFETLGDAKIAARFYERGAGATLSSGTGAVGAAVAAIAREEASSPVSVVAQTDTLEIRWTGRDAYLRGPAEIVARGRYYCLDAAPAPRRGE
jgi:diaminopimelate epimerase